MDLDPSLAQGLRRGSPDALAEVYRLHGAAVHRLCLRILGRATEAEDATQEVFVRLLERASTFEGRSALRTWIHRLTVNHCLHRLEKERRRDAEALPTDLLSGDPSPVEAAERGESRERLATLLARLPIDLRVALVLREIEQLSVREIAETLGIPEGTVLSRLFRARERLSAWVAPPAAPSPTTRP